MRPLATLCTLLLIGSAGRAAAGRSFERLVVGTPSAVRSLAFSPDGTTFVTGGDAGRIILWKTSNGKPLRQFEGATEPVRSVAFSPDGATIATCGFDKCIRLWEAKTGKLKLTIDDTADNYWPCFSPDGKLLLTASGENEPRIWDTSTGKLKVKLTGHTAKAWSAALSPDGATIATGGQDKSIKLWNSSTGECFRTLIGHTDSVTALKFSPDGKTLASCGNDGTARVWDIQTGELKRIFYVTWGGTRDAAFTSDGSMLVTAGDDDELKMWDLKTGEMCKCVRAINQCVTFTPDAKYLVGAGTSGNVTFLDWKGLRDIVASGRGRRDLRPELTKLGLAQPRNQNPRGTCAFFTMTDLVSFAIAKRTGKPEFLSVDCSIWSADHFKTPDNYVKGYETYGICAEELMPYSREDGPKEPSEEAKADALQKRDVGVKNRGVENWPVGIRPEDGYVSNIKAEIDKGIPVGSFSHHCIILVGYIDDPDYPGGGMFIGRDSATVSYHSVTYDYIRSHTGGFPIWE